ncbi:MAG: HAMP domain-containing sensor histidine kinase [Parcubacteria group bacterium]|jgi:two-component system phosphate regulon sensor histidine kinase PhoR
MKKSFSKIKEADKMKDNFISMASHELRSPITALKGYLELLSDRNKDKMDEESARYLKNMKSSINRLDSLVSDILEISKLEGTCIPLKITAFNLQPVIQKILEEMRFQASQKGLAIKHPESAIPMVKADKARTEQILINLVSNAIKYTMKGKIEIIAKVKNKELLITVTDTGVGISSKDIEKLFEKFYRIKDNGLESVSGTGLGLWISRGLARKMNGDITAESTKNIGSRFTLHLPLA